MNGFKHNLLSFNQLCDNGFRVIFEFSHCFIQDRNANKISFIGRRIDNVYVTNLDNISSTSIKFLASLNDESWSWHRRLGYVNMRLI